MTYNIDLNSPVRPFVSLDNIVIWNGGIINEKNIINKAVKHICNIVYILVYKIAMLLSVIGKELNIIMDKSVSLLFNNNFMTNHNFNIRLISAFLIGLLIGFVIGVVCDIGYRIYKQVIVNYRLGLGLEFNAVEL